MQVVLVGDSWQELVVPVGRDNPVSLIVFCGAYLTLVFGVLSIVVSVITDKFAELRARDVHTLAEDRMEDEIKEKRHLSKMFMKIDTDDSGKISLDELEVGAHEIAEFSDRLRALDIT